MLRLVQGAGNPGPPLREARAHSPPPGCSGSQAKGKLELALVQRPLERRSQVRKLALHLLLGDVWERDLFPGHGWLPPLDPGEEVGGSLPPLGQG